MNKGITVSSPHGLFQELVPTYTQRLMTQLDNSDDDVRLIIIKQILDYIGEDMVKEIFLSYDMGEYDE